MTKRNRKRPPLKRLRRQAVEVDFNGGTLTSDGGLLLLREVDKRFGLVDRIDQAIPVPRDPIYTAHPQAEILISRIFGIAAGYEDANDHHTLRHDPAFQVAVGRTPAENDYSEESGNSPLASPSTHSRFENRIDSKAIFKLHEIFIDTFLDSYDQPPEEIILDYDATDDTVHGNQQRRCFNGFYDSYCFLPLYVFCGDQLLVSYLRPSSVGAAHHAAEITRLLVNKIRSRWPSTRIILRGDSGYAIERLMRWSDKHEVGYVFGLQKNNVLVREIACEMTRARIKQAQFCSKHACFKWFRYRTTESWGRHRWVVGKAEYSGKGSNPRFVVTNLPSSEGIVDPTYHRFRVDGIRRLALEGTRYARLRVDTIRRRLLKIAARVGVTCQRVIFHLPTHCPHANLFNHVLERHCPATNLANRGEKNATLARMNRLGVRGPSGPSCSNTPQN